MELPESVVKFLGIVVIALLGLSLYYLIAFPRVGPPEEIVVNSTPEMIERGRYLANNVAICIDCHSKRDWRYYAGPVVPGTEGMGGNAFTKKMEIPGSLYSQNITPAGIGDWTDGELIRAITTGVSNDGTALYPLMPYPSYKIMAKEDVHAIVAYLRSLKPIENTDIPERKLKFPHNLKIRLLPSEAEPQPRPDSSDTLAYGKYLAIIADCAGCHTPTENGFPIDGMYMAGGGRFEFPSGAVVRTENITPDKETGIGTWTREDFIQRFKMYAGSNMHRVKVPEGGMNTIMPWIMYAGMTEQDLGAIYTYLQSVQPVRNEIVRYTPPPSE